MNANIYALFASRFPRDRSRICIETDTGRCYSYADVERETARLARFFTVLGLQRGDRVAAQVEKSTAALFVYLAAVRAGLAYLPLNVAYQRGEVEYFLNDAAPAMLICRPLSLAQSQQLANGVGRRHVYTLDEDGNGSLMDASRDGLPEFETVAVETDELAAILYTSGTTGRSKGAMLSHKNLAANVRVLHDYWGFRPDDVLLHTLPIFHIHGLFVAANLCLYSGGKMFFLKKFDARQVLDYLPRCTVFMGVPTYYTRLLAEPGLTAETCRGVRLFVSGSAPLLAETFAAFRSRTGHTILERYGMSETGMNTSNPLHGERRPGAVGLPLPGTSVRVTDDANRCLPVDAIGNIQVKGDNVFSGYWRRPEKTKDEFTGDGYFKTGDMGKLDAEGYVSIVGRSRDLVISGGYNVYPKEIETLIDAIPGVAESAVIGMPHADFGEAVVAVVVKDAAASDVTGEAIIQRMKAEVANYKVPKAVFFVEELPRNAMGKVLKSVLQEQLGSAGRVSEKGD